MALKRLRCIYFRKYIKSLFCFKYINITIELFPPHFVTPDEAEEADIAHPRHRRRLHLALTHSETSYI